MFSKLSNDVKYLIIFHCDFDKWLHISFFRIKEKIFQTFFNYKKQNEYKNEYIERLKSNNENEYMFEEFEEFKFQNDIKWKFIVSNNFAQNDKTERLNETLHRKINIMRTIISFNIKWWKKLIFIANYLRNKQFIAKRNVIFYESHIDRLSNLKHLRIIKQTNYV